VPLIYLSCAWVLGVFLGARLGLPWPIIFVGLTPLPFLRLFSQHRRRIILVSLCLVAFFGGSVRFQSSQPVINQGSLQFYNGQETQLKGLITADPEPGEKTAQLRLSATEITTGEGWREVSGDTLLIMPRYSDYRYGDVLLVTGNLETPVQFDDFDYRSYLAQQGIHSTMLYPQAEIIDRGQGFAPLAQIYAIRASLSHSLAEALPEPQGSLAQGIILGVRGNIPTSVKADFSHTGTAHLLAISGLHLGIMAGMLLGLGVWLLGRKRYLYIWLTLGIIWAYAMLTGMHPPIIRAAIMVSLFLTAEILGRQRSAVTALALAAAVMVGIEPRLLWSASFQMSFMAMMGLISLFPLFQSAGRKAVNAAWGEGRRGTSAAYFIADGFSVTLAALAGVGPLIAYYFGIISFVSPPATLLTLPVLPAIIVSGGLAGSLGLVAPAAAQVVGWIAWGFLSYLLAVVSAFAAIPLSFVRAAPIAPSLLWLYYAALAAVLYLTRRRRAGTIAEAPPPTTTPGTGRIAELLSSSPRKWLIPPLLAAAVLLSAAAAAMPDDNLHVSFLNVGQGDAILIHRGTQQVLVDGGPSPQAITVELGKKMPFWDRTIELVVSTHPSADHLTGLVEVVDRYRVERVLQPETDSQSGIYGQWLQVLEEKDTECLTARAGQRIDLGGGAVIEVLNPQAPPLEGTYSDEDNNGIILRVTMGEASFLLTADAMAEAESELMICRASLESTVLKVGHHGSNTSTTPRFLAVVDPQLAVISVGANNTYGHPTDEVTARLAEKVGAENIYRTDRDGAIEFVTDGEKLWVETEK